MLAHSEKEQTAPTWKKTFGFHPRAAFADHGTGAAGEALPIMLRPGNARSNTASEHIDVIRLALAQVPGRLRRRVLIRTDPGGGTYEFLAWPAGRRPHYSVGMTISEDIAEAILTLRDRIWEPAFGAEGKVQARNMVSWTRSSARPQSPLVSAVASRSKAGPCSAYRLRNAVSACFSGDVDRLTTGDWRRLA